MNASSVVILGGGTGTYTVLTGLKPYPVKLTAIVSTADDGGSTGELRDQYGVLPPGDILRSLVALSDAPDVLRELFNYRFEDGDNGNALGGHRLGNLILTALEKIFGGPLEGLEIAHRILKVAERHRVVPVSRIPANLVAELENGETVRGEHDIGVPKGPRAPIRRCYLDPPVEANPEALVSIARADLIVIAMGDLYTSIAPVLKVDGVAEALAQAKAPIIYNLNLATKAETEDYQASRFVQVVQRLMHPVELSAVIVNTGRPDEALVRRHVMKSEPLVVDDLRPTGHLLIIRRDLLATSVAERNPADKLADDRSLLRHDPDKLAAVILECLTLHRTQINISSAAPTTS